MARVKSYGPGTDFYPVDLNNIQDDYEKSFSAWKPLTVRSGSIQPSAAGDTWMMYSGSAGTAAPTGPGAYLADYALFLDPADYAVGARTPEFRVRGTLHVNSVLPGRAITLGLVRIATSTTLSAGDQLTAATLASAATGSAVTATGLVANTRVVTTTPAFTLAAADEYALAAQALVGGIAANSVISILLQLQYRLV